MAIKFRITLRQRIRNTVRTRWAALLDVVCSPAISRLTDDEYFSCRSRNDCLRSYARRRFVGA
jgi:hypothetical protein